jgi:DNA (cytosine-5)-methyltransferase 1
MTAPLRYLSVCSGIEAASVAWAPLMWSPVGFAEIEAFPSAVLAHHYGSNLPAQPWSGNAPPNFGDMTRFKEWPDADFDVLVGGTPCQAFSVAGLRKGLSDPRGNLALTFLGIVDRYHPRCVVWENVPGVLSVDGGRAFGAFLGGLAELGYGWAYRVIDAQYVRVDGFGRAVPQRRRRVFVVGNSRDWRRAAAVLFEPESLSGNPPPRREEGKGAAPTISSRPTGGGGLGTDFDLDGGLIPDVCGTLSDGAHMGGGLNGQDVYSGRIIPVAHALRADGFDTSEDGMGRGTPLVPVVADTITANWERSKGAKAGNQVGLINPIILPFNITPSNSNTDFNAREAEYAQALTQNGNRISARGGDLVRHQWAVRRLTPRECERLQGFPDDYTLIPYRGKPAADGPRYKALGNSMAVNVMRWIGRRIELVDSIVRQDASPSPDAGATPPSAGDGNGDRTPSRDGGTG